MDQGKPSVASTSFKDAATAWLNDRYGVKAAEAGELGGGIDNWIDQAISLTGVEANWKPALKWLAKHESSFNPRAENPEAVGREHATGLMQTLPSTFNENALSGMHDIYNPVHNMSAAIRYIKRRYGHPQNAVNGWAARGGY